ncbi:MAG: outer membrane beta-barrel protein [Gammaproteobacteria bacterium]
MAVSPWSFVPDARAFVVDYGVGYTGIYDSNIFRAPTDEQAEFTNRYNANLSIEQAGANLIATSYSFLSYQDYVNETRSNQVFLTNLSQATWFVRPGSMAWQFEDYYTQLAVDSTQPGTPNNVQGTNVFQTGPDFAFRLGTQDSIDVELRYGNYYYADSALGNQRYSGLLQWSHLLTPNLNFSVDLLGTSVDYDDDLAARDFNRYDLFWRGEATRGWNVFYLDAGVTRIEPTDREEFTGFFADVAWNRVISSVSQITLSLGANYTDTGRDIRQGAAVAAAGFGGGLLGAPAVPGVGLGATGGGGTVLANTFVTNEIFYSEHADLAYFYTDAPLGGSLRVSGRKDEFEGTVPDREFYGTLLNLRYNLTATLQTLLFFEYTRTKYEQIERQDDDIDVRLTLDYLMSPKWTLNIGTAWIQRTSTDPINEFDDLQAFVGLRYYSIPGF